MRHLSINASSRLYMCNTYFQSMYQEGQTVIILEIVSPLERLQRRMHQRVSCHAMISYRILQDKEIHDMIDREDAVSFPQTGMAADAETESLIDISGGGVRFTSKSANKFFALSGKLFTNFPPLRGSIITTGIFFDAA